jgi:hypothetical protein
MGNMTTVATKNRPVRIAKADHPLSVQFGINHGALKQTPCNTLIPILLGLHFPETGIFTRLLQQLVMGTLFNESACFQD